MRVVAALGGNALLERGERPDAEVQEHHVADAAAALATVADRHELIVTHGNGPQVGVIAEESAADEKLTGPYPFDVLGAETQGMIGYFLLQALENALPGRKVASLVTQTIVDGSDPGFANPTKFVGPVYTAEQAAQLAAEHGWPMKPDGDRFRRVVASPEPKGFVELASIEALLSAGVIPICVGGGGVPVVERAPGHYEGVEAVIDKDLAASLLATELGADVLVLLTDVPAVMVGYGTPEARPLRETTPAELRALSFPAGSMGPKVEAVCRFVEHGGKLAAIGRLTDVAELVDGRTGTVVT